MLVFGQIGNGLEPFFILRTGKKHVPDTAGQEIEKDADQFTGMNGPPKGRKTDLEADCDAVFAAFAGCAGEDFSGPGVLMAMSPLFPEPLALKLN